MGWSARNGTLQSNFDNSSLCDESPVTVYDESQVAVPWWFYASAQVIEDIQISTLVDACASVQCCCDAVAQSVCRQWHGCAQCNGGAPVCLSVKINRARCVADYNGKDAFQKWTGLHATCRLGLHQHEQKWQLLVCLCIEFLPLTSRD